MATGLLFTRFTFIRGSVLTSRSHPCPQKVAGYARENPRIFHNLAIAYWQQEQVDSAVAAFLRAIELEPNNPQFVQNLLQLLAQKQRWKEALPYARRMVELTPTNPQTINFLREIERQISP